MFMYSYSYVPNNYTMARVDLQINVDCGVIRATEYKASAALHSAAQNDFSKTPKI